MSATDIGGTVVSVTDGFPSQRASNEENFPLAEYHHDY